MIKELKSNFWILQFSSNWTIDDEYTIVDGYIFCGECSEKVTV